MTVLAQAEAAAYRSSVCEAPATMACWLLDNLGQQIATVGLGLKGASLIGAPPAAKAAQQGPGGGVLAVAALVGSGLGSAGSAPVGSTPARLR